jgi:REP element-mobilizing transposase RayT
VQYHRRRLPHWQPEGRALFITFRLAGSLPAERGFQPEAVTSGQAFALMDRVLDAGQAGPRYLVRPELAEVVAGAIREGASRRNHYLLHAFAVMPNHVHLLVTPRVDGGVLLRQLKGATAREINRRLALTGRALWQNESYDHWVRDQEEFERIRRYIEGNPVRAGICAEAEEYRWSSAWRG